ncbi:MAG: hypothetical protein H6961_07275 [Chromatiaceae bacterium]|nr:hypothetical protein [Chromatiaceae bacterium]
MSLSIRDKWLMEHAFDEGIHGFYETFDDWISQVVDDKTGRTVEDELLSFAPKNGSEREILP